MSCFFFQISAFLQLLPVDGLWIDMNEISNFCNGACSPETHRKQGIKITDVPSRSGTRTWLKKRGTKTAKKAVGFDPINPPYAINNWGGKVALNAKTLDMDCEHMNGAVLEYDAHNLYSLSEAIATSNALETLTKKRSFVISRSTFPGSGLYTGHWTGQHSLHAVSNTTCLRQLISLKMTALDEFRCTAEG